MLKNFKFFFVFYLVLIALCFTSLFAFVSNVKADSNITLEDGAEIRTTGKEGIRFIANANDLTDYTEFGFVCAKGTYSLSEMTNAFNAAEWSSMEDLNTNTFTYESGSSNGINMIRSYQSNLESGSKEIKLTIFDINEANYLTDLSVFAYGIVNDAPVFSNISVSRNIAEVAALAKLSGDTSELVDVVVSGVKSAYKAVEVLNEKVSVFSYSSVSSLELEDLKAEFIADVNAFCGTSLTAECTMKELANILANVSWGWSPVPTAYGQDITSSNIFKFFQNGAMRAKWSFLMEYLISNGAANTKLQAFEILDDGLYTDAQNTFGASKGLFGGDHAVSEIWLILNQSEATYAAGGGNLNKDYTDPAKYEVVKQYCIAGTTERLGNLVKVGDKIILPSFEKTGYTFNGWNDGANLLAGSSEYTITKNDIVFTTDLTPITYTIKYYNKNDEYTELAETYTIEKSVTLPTLDNYDACVFGGWYDNPELSGDPVETISKGTTGEKVYFAKWSLKVDTIIVDDDYSEMENGAKVEVEGESEEYIVGTNAFATIKEGLEVANENATIIVAAGTYADALSITKPVTIIGANKELVLAHNSTYTVSAESDSIISALVRIENGANDVTIKGFVATNQIILYGNENVNISYLLFASPKATISDRAGAVNINAESNTVTLDHLYYNGKGEVSRLVYFYANITDFTISNSVIMNGASGLYDIIRGNDSSQIIGEFTVSKNYFQSVTQAAINIQQIGECECVVENNIFYKVYSGIYFRTENSNNITYTIQYNEFDSCGYASSTTYYPVRINSTKKSSIININHNIIKNSLGNYLIYIANSTMNVDASNNYFNNNKTNNCLNATNSDKVAEESACGPRQ